MSTSHGHSWQPKKAKMSRPSKGKSQVPKAPKPQSAPKRRRGRKSRFVEVEKVERGSIIVDRAPRGAPRRDGNIDAERDYICLDDINNDLELPTGFPNTYNGPEKVFYPWWSNNRLKKTTPDCLLEALNREINYFIHYIKPRHAEKTMRRYLIHKVSVAIRNAWPNATVTPFGSYATDLYLPDGDIDLVVKFNGFSNDRRVLDQLADIISTNHISRSFPQVISNATVPVIKFTDRLTNIKVDVILNADSGVKSSHYVNDTMHAHPGMQELVLILKHLLAMRNLNEVFTGGMGGYALSCLVESFMQMQPKLAQRTINAKENLGTLLMELLKLYGINFNAGRVGIDVKRGRFFKAYGHDRFGNPVFTITDPNDSNNDLGAKSFKTREIREVFKKAYFSLYGVMHDYLEFGMPSTQFNTSTVIFNHIGVIPLSMMEQRANIMRVYRQGDWRKEKYYSSFCE
ncbi:Nucleotidyltransferase [Hesseltinella vesiculosa]|uniref:polynucleotide adenylyltransferase n=1 Tax=Hesseltinella vesiculosa TaxID=101127 RepID=A0A1X2GSB4_9FUNG|nr:Nucleotidyltransferase [Hesseltinella vesiculosa]